MAKPILNSKDSLPSEKSMSISSQSSLSRSFEMPEPCTYDSKSEMKGSVQNASPSTLLKLNELSNSDLIQLPKPIFEKVIHELQVTKKENLDLKNKLQEKSEQTENVPQSSTSAKAPAVRANSMPEKKEETSFQHPEIRRVSYQEIRKYSNPEIFIFPDCRNLSNNSNPSSLLSSARSSQNNKDSDVRSEADGAPVSGDNDELLSMKSQPLSGVSEQYFVQAIKELERTKKQMRILQNQQRLEAKEREDLQKLKILCPKLDLTRQKLQNEVASLRRENDALKTSLLSKESQSKPPSNVGKEDSFELESKSSAESQNSQLSAHKSAEMRNYHEVQRLRASNDELTKQNRALQHELAVLHQGTIQSQMDALTKHRDELKAELEDLNREYDILKDSVKILSTCLHEEKARNRKVEEQCKKSKAEVNKLSQMIISLRNQYEELRQEKTAAEKELSIYRDDGVPQHRRNLSGELLRSQHQKPSRVPDTHSSYPLNIGSSYSQASAMNNLSEGEEKMSNLPPPAFSCFRCLQTFHVENSYLLHLNKCID